MHDELQNPSVTPAMTARNHEPPGGPVIHRDQHLHEPVTTARDPALPGVEPAGAELAGAGQDQDLADGLASAADLADLAGCACDERSTVRAARLKADLTARLNRIEGQVRGIKSMIERDAYCDDVLNQIAAAQAALKAVSKLLLKNHIQGCVVDRIGQGDREIIDELLITINKML